MLATIQETTKQENIFDEFAVIDIGSNSIYLLVVREINGTLQIVTKIKQHVRLASGLNAQKELRTDMIDQAISCLAMFAERLKDFPLSHVRVVATYTLRIAKNRNEFLERALKVLPYPVEIISGQEEARLIYFGASHTETLPETKLVIDIGGGSTEIAMGLDFSPLLVDSRPMGCVTFTQLFFPNEQINKVNFYRAKLAAEQQVEKVSALVKQQNCCGIAFGTSSTIKSVHEILIEMGVSDGIITRQRLEDLTQYLLEFKQFSEIDFPALQENRRPVFVAGFAILCGLFNRFELDELHYCQSALREGVLYEMIGGFGCENIQERTAQALSKEYNIDEKYANNVVNTAKYLFKQWQSQAKSIEIEASLEAILYWAAMLHEVGLNINNSSIQKHSAYILHNSNLPGFNQEQQQLLAILVRYHRKTIKIANIPYFNLFELKQVIPLLQILRLSVLLNNQRRLDLPLEKFKLNIIDEKQNHLELEIAASVAEENRLIQLELEQEQLYWESVKNGQLTVNIKN